MRHQLYCFQKDEVSHEEVRSEMQQPPQPPPPAALGTLKPEVAPSRLPRTAGSTSKQTNFGR